MAFCSKCGASLPDGAQFCGVCGSPVGGAGPARPAQPAQPQYGGYQQPNNSWDSYGGGYGAPPQGKAAPSNKATLRILSIVFAVGFLIFSFGMSGNIFYNRQVDSAVKESYESYEKYLDEAKSEGWMSAEEVKKSKDEMQKQINLAKKTAWRTLAPTLKCDVVGVMRASVAEYSEYDVSDYTDSEKKELRDRIKENKESTEERIKDMTAKELKEEREYYAKQNEEGIENVGFRYVWLIVSAYNSIFMIIGGALALIALIAWIAMGGLSGPISETAIVPVVAACFALGVLLMIIFGLCISPIKTEDLR